MPGLPSGAAFWHLGGRPDQGLAEGQVEVHGARAGGVGDRFRHRSGGQGAPRPRGRRVGDARRRRPPYGAAEQAFLLDGLGRPDPVLLRRAVGGDREQRDTSLVGLDDGGVLLGGGGPAGRDHHRGPAPGQPEPEGQESRRSLVQHHVDPQAPVRRQGQEQGRRTGPGRHHGVGDAGAHPLVDHGGGERGLDIAGPCHARIIRCCRPRWWERGARWSRSTGSPRPIGRGSPSPSGFRRSISSPWSTRPATADRRRCGPTCTMAPGCWARSGAAPPTSGTPWVPGCASIWRSSSPAW